jgi:hypothetical protein
MKRPETYHLQDGTGLSPDDVAVLRHLVGSIQKRLTRPDYSLADIDALGLLQHYGLPTPLIDFTSQLGHAITFAAARHGDVGRICVFPFESFQRVQAVSNLTEHKWAERPRRQSAFGIFPTRDLTDLKSHYAHSQLKLQWFQFSITEREKEIFRPKHEELVNISNDRSAGFIRYNITEYVEAHGKLSPALTQWLLERIPIAPWCAHVRAFEGQEVVLSHDPLLSLPEFDTEKERERSRRYWSQSFPDCSWDRMKGWSWPAVDTVFADPRTFHPKP